MQYVMCCFYCDSIVVTPDKLVKWHMDFMNRSADESTYSQVFRLALRLLFKLQFPGLLQRVG
jgi:hypothetical protein